MTNIYVVVLTWTFGTGIQSAWSLRRDALNAVRELSRAASQNGVRPKPRYVIQKVRLHPTIKRAV